MEKHVARDRHGVLKVALNFVEDILGRTAKEDCASFGLGALGNESKVLITNFLYLKETTSCSNVGLSNIIDTIHDGGAGSACDTVVISLANTAKSSDVALEEVVLGEVLMCISIMIVHPGWPGSVNDRNTHQIHPSQ